jgi:hypothetical protein
MDRLPLIGGSYSARSIISNAQRCINYYPESNRPDSPTPITHYQRPGFRPLGDPTAAIGPGRGIWQASNGAGYCVIGTGFYYIQPGWVLQLLGNLSLGRSNPCTFADNGITGVVADGSASGWYFTLATNAGWAQTVDASFTGADRFDYLDTFLLWNVPGTNQFRSSLSNQWLPLDPLYVASKTGFPDQLQSLIVNRRQIVLLGTLKTEIWDDEGLPAFPFARVPGAYTEHGTVAKYSLASSDISVFFLGKNLQGTGTVFRQRAYQCSRISNHALEFAIRQMARAGTIADAIGYTYQIDGHVFYVLSFPNGNQTWVYDDAIDDPLLAWHQRCWTDGDGNLNRDRSMGCASLYGLNVALDWELGTLYSLDPTYYLDTVGGVDYSISFIRSFPHLMQGIVPATGMPMLSHGKLVQHTQFRADLECGNTPLQLGPDGVTKVPAQIWLRWSDDRGRTFGQSVLQSAGAQGEYITQPKWAGLGAARDRVYEIGHTIAGEAALNGAWVEGNVLGQ